jgi:hypothetical protein
MHRPLVYFGALMALLVPVAAIGMLVDDRVLLGSPIWFKPLKFAVSFVFYSFSLAWLLKFLPENFRRVGWWSGTVIVVASLIEMIIIVGQVVRGTRSHFNFTTTFDAVMFGIMGATITVLWMVHALVAFLLLRTRFENKALAWSVRFGLVISFFGLGVAFLMIGPKSAADAKAGIIGAHTVGAPDGGSYMALTGWSTEAGDLRVPHFVGLHALQVLPIVIGLLGRWADARLAWVLSGSYFAFFLLTTWQAMRGQSVFAPDPLTISAFVAIAAATGVAGRWALQPVRQASYA